VQREDAARAVREPRARRGERDDPALRVRAVRVQVEEEAACRRGGEPARRLRLGDFLLGPYRTALRPGEALVSVRIPPVPEGAAVAHQKFAVHERPTATVSCLVRVADGRVAEARVAVGSVGLLPVRCTEAERLLAGLPTSEITDERNGGSRLNAAAEAAAEAASPMEDANGSVEYKAQLVRVLVERTLRQALRQ
jgi:carbon-monoxide dehydrogenase medium subunit